MSSIDYELLFNRLGDTKKMIEFAQLARDSSLFVLAANYLRSAQVGIMFFELFFAFCELFFKFEYLRVSAYLQDIWLYKIRNLIFIKYFLKSWADDPQVLKAIVTFYRKAKKLDSLTKFFIETSQHAIDTAGDYERGMTLLGECIKVLAPSKSDTSDHQSSVRERAMKIKEFLDARKVRK